MMNTASIRLETLLLLILMTPSCALVDGRYASAPDDDPTQSPDPLQALDFADFVVRQDNATHPGGGELSCTQAACPPGSVLLGGGADFGGVTLTENGPIPGIESWRACGRATESVPWGAQAICAAAYTTVTRAEAMRGLDVGEQACAQSLCPAGSIALSGGWVSSDSTVGASRLGSESWTVCGQGEQPGATVISRAICADTRTAFVDFGAGERRAPAERPEACIEASCPAGYQIVSGGGAWVDGVELTRSVQASAQQWRMCGVAPMGGMSKWNLEAICLPDPPPDFTF